jgi:hypothetical protein
MRIGESLSCIPSKRFLMLIELACTFSLANEIIYSEATAKNAPDTSSRLITAFEHES